MSESCEFALTHTASHYACCRLNLNVHGVLFVCLLVLVLMCLSMCLYAVQYSQRTEGLLDPLELQLQMVVNRRVGAEN